MNADDIDINRAGAFGVDEMTSQTKLKHGDITETAAINIEFFLHLPTLLSKPTRFLFTVVKNTKYLQIRLVDPTLHFNNCQKMLLIHCNPSPMRTTQFWTHGSSRVHCLEQISEKVEHVFLSKTGRP